MQLKLMALIAFVCGQTLLFGQWTGANPVIQNGEAKVKDNVTIGKIAADLWVPGLISTPDRRLNIHKKLPGGVGYPLGTPLSTYTTGLKFVHTLNAYGSNPKQNYNWEIASDKSRMFFHFANTNTTLMSITSDGAVGIGTTAPDATLHVRNINGSSVDTHLEGYTLIDGLGAALLLGRQTGSPSGEWGISYNNGSGGMNFFKPYGATTGGGNYHLFIKDNGKISMGLDPNLPETYNGDYKLYVARGIMTEKLKVALKSSTDWADYVFDASYDLKPLAEVEKFIRTNKHLPGIPSAEEVVATGIDVAKMDAKLLEKIEELTLYMIALEKDNKAIRAEMKSLKEKL